MLCSLLSRPPFRRHFQRADTCDVMVQHVLSQHARLMTRDSSTVHCYFGIPLRGNCFRHIPRSHQIPPPPPPLLPPPSSYTHNHLKNACSSTSATPASLSEQKSTTLLTASSSSSNHSNVPSAPLENEKNKSRYNTSRYNTSRYNKSRCNKSWKRLTGAGTVHYQVLPGNDEMDRTSCTVLAKNLFAIDCLLTVHQAIYLPPKGFPSPAGVRNSRVSDSLRCLSSVVLPDERSTPVNTLLSEF